MQVLCSTGSVTHCPTRADHRLVAEARELPADGFELSIYTNWLDGDEAVGDELAALRLPIETAYAEEAIGARLSEGDGDAVARLVCNQEP